MNQNSLETPENTIKFQKKAQRYLLTSIIILVLGVFLTLVFMSLANQQVKKFQASVQNKFTLEQSQTEGASLQVFVSQNKDQLLLISDIFPNESNILEFIQSIEALVHQSDSTGSVRFSALSPVKILTDLTIPMTIQVKVTPHELINLLRQLERLPYIMEVTSVDMQSPEGLSNISQITLGVRVYVQEPFKAASN